MPNDSLTVTLIAYLGGDPTRAYMQQVALPLPPNTEEEIAVLLAAPHAYEAALWEPLGTDALKPGQVPTICFEDSFIGPCPYPVSA